jgi:hypothetical protein
MPGRSARAIAPSPSELAVLFGLGLTPGAWTALYLGLMLALSELTIFNRGRRIVDTKGRAA